MAKYSFGFIGTGNMGGALARAAAKALLPEELLLANRTPAKAQALAKELGCRAGDNTQVAAECRYIFLGVKPQMMADMLSGIAPVLKARQDRFVLVSMAAGLTIARIREMAGGDYPVLRIMPNTPAALGAGMTLLTPDEKVTEEEMAYFTASMAASGRMERLPERLIDAGSAVSGCGPAFAYMFMEALADGGVAVGLPRAQALDLAAQTLLGAARMVLESGKHPGQLKDEVCSPGGSTIMGVRALEARGFRAAALEAVLEACAKTKELGK